ncbi:MAG TPA: hypothetical protein EYH27_05765 [Anaerolineales bacterium]|nr:hypothetical protein [Anaerolineales bacterium]
MKVLLAWLVDFSWIVYAACGLGALVYLIRALAVQQRLGASLTTFEREMITAQANRLWGIALGFVLVGVVVFFLQTYFIPRALPDLEPSPTPEVSFGLTPIPSPTPTATRVMGELPTLPPTAPPPPPPTALPTELPTSTPAAEAGEGLPSIPVGARFGDVAELVGYDLANDQVTSSEGVALTLYWRALEGAATAEYVVFTHLLTPDGWLIAQHDGPPAGGARPTTGWVAGEVIVDPHVLVFNDEGAAYTGEARLAVGLYLGGAPQARVSLAGGGDHVVLPTVINVIVLGP